MQVIITSKKSSDSVVKLSYREDELSSGEFYAIKKFGGSSLTLFIEVNAISMESSPAYADISIFLRDLGQSSKNRKVNKKKKSKKKKKKQKNKKKKKSKNRRLGSAIRILS